MIRRRPTSLAGAPRGVKGPRRASHGLTWGSRLRWGIGILVVVVGLVYLMWPVFSMLLAAATLAYLLDPVVDRLEARGYKRETGIIAIFAMVAAALALMVLGVVPSVVNQVAELSGNLSAYTQALTERIEPWRLLLEEKTGRNIPVSISEVGAGIPTYIQQLSPDAKAWIQNALRKSLSGGLGFVLAVFNLAILPIFTFYLLRDWDRLIAFFHDLVPQHYRSLVFPVVAQIDERMAAFVRGQITVCMVLAVLYSLGLWLVARIDLPFVVGIGSGMLFIVPYLGTIVGVVSASLLALLKYGVDWHLLAVWGTFGGVQLLEGTVLTPYIVGDKVGLPPLVVMIALIAGGSLLGIWGMLLAIPITAALSVLLRTLQRIYRASSFYQQP